MHRTQYKHVHFDVAKKVFSEALAAAAKCPTDG
jgi:hypothetical protein